MRSYSELCQLSTIEERYNYLVIRGAVGDATFGFDRYLNQRFYTSSQWRRVRSIVISRDMGCDLGIPGYEIFDRVVIHHMNPMRPADLIGGESDVLDPEYLITTTHDTHNAIHYGAGILPTRTPIERRPGDTVPWR